MISKLYYFSPSDTSGQDPPLIMVERKFTIKVKKFDAFSQKEKNEIIFFLFHCSALCNFVLLCSVNLLTNVKRHSQILLLFTHFLIQECMKTSFENNYKVLNFLKIYLIYYTYHIIYNSFKTFFSTSFIYPFKSLNPNNIMIPSFQIHSLNHSQIYFSIQTKSKRVNKHTNK